MALEDSLWKTYLLGTKEENSKYQEKNHFKKAYPLCMHHILFMGEVAVGIAVISVNPVLNGIILLDVLSRVNSKSDGVGPSLIGRVRELYQKYKKKDEI